MKKLATAFAFRIWFFALGLSPLLMMLVVIAYYYINNEKIADDLGTILLLIYAVGFILSIPNLLILIAKSRKVFREAEAQEAKRRVFRFALLIWGILFVLFGFTIAASNGFQFPGNDLIWLIEGWTLTVASCFISIYIAVKTSKTDASPLSANGDGKEL